MLRVQGVSANDDRSRPSLHDVTFTVGRGEIVGVAGVAGNGQRELAEVIAGMRAGSVGTISVNGQPVQTGRVRKSISAGIAHVPEDRLHTGLAPSHSVQDNLVLKSYRSSPISKLTVLVQKMIVRPRGRELIIGLARDPSRSQWSQRARAFADLHKGAARRTAESAPTAAASSAMPTARPTTMGSIRKARRGKR